MSDMKENMNNSESHEGDQSIEIQSSMENIQEFPSRVRATSRGLRWTKTHTIAGAASVACVAIAGSAFAFFYNASIDFESYDLQPDKTVIVTVTPESPDKTCSSLRLDSFDNTTEYSMPSDEFLKALNEKKTGPFNPIDEPSVVENLKCPRQYVFMGSVNGSSNGSAVKLSFPSVLRVTADNDRTVELANDKLNELLQADGSLIDHLYNAENGDLK